MIDFETHSGNQALVSSTGRTLTYGELGKLSECIARHIEPRRLVFLLCSTSIGSIAGYLAFINNDDASLLLDSKIDRKAFENLVETYHPEYIWAPAGSKLTECYDKLIELEEYALYRLHNPSPTPIADNLSILLATSGSLGSPKMVRLTKDNLRSNALSIIEYLNITEKERAILGLPMNYAFGLSIINTHLMAGAALLLSERPFIERAFWDFAIKNNFTSYSGVPYAFETIRKMEIWKLEMPSLRTLTQAGGTLNRDTVSFFDRTFSPKGVKFYVMYGQAEASARISYLEPEHIPDRPGSIGKAIPGGSISIVDEIGNVITAPDTVGELVYKGPNVSMGYAECAADLTKGDENKGIVHTGDLAFMDSDGYFYISGRKGRYVKLFGHRISLDYAEIVLQPILGECACNGDDSHLNVYTTNTLVRDQTVVDMLSSLTKIHKKAFSVHHLAVLPRTESGKVRYEELNSHV